MSDRDRIAKAMLGGDPFEAAAARGRAKYQGRLDADRLRAVPPAAVDPKYLALPASENVADRRATSLFDPYTLTGLNRDQWKSAWDYLTTAAERERGDKAAALARVTPDWRRSVPDDLSGNLPRQIGFFDTVPWHTGGIGTR